MSSNTIRHHNQHEQMIQNEANIQKAQAPTSSQQQDPVKQNEPFILNGIFWNVNHSYKAKENFSSPRYQQLDLGFEGQIYRKHLNVAKMCFKKYNQLFSTEDCPEQNGSEIINQCYQNMFTRPRDWIKACQNFISSLASDEQFTQSQIKILSRILNNDPLVLNVFQILGEVVPYKYRAKFYALLFHGVQLCSSLKQYSTLDEKNNMKIIDKKIEELIEVLMKYEDSQAFKEFLRIILYTSAMAGLGRGQNLFYETLVRQFPYQDSLNQTRFERQLNQFTKDKPKKAKLVRRNTLGNIIMEGGVPKKRFNSIDP